MKGDAKKNCAKPSHNSSDATGRNKKSRSNFSYWIQIIIKTINKLTQIFPHCQVTFNEPLLDSLQHFLVVGGPESRFINDVVHEMVFGKYTCSVSSVPEEKIISIRSRRISRRINAWRTWRQPQVHKCSTLWNNWIASRAFVIISKLFQLTHQTFRRKHNQDLFLRQTSDKQPWMYLPCIFSCLKADNSLIRGFNYWCISRKSFNLENSPMALIAVTRKPMRSFVSFSACILSIFYHYAYQVLDFNLMFKPRFKPQKSQN